MLEYPITTFQPTYFCAESLEDAKLKMIEYCNSEVRRPFNVSYDVQTGVVSTDR